MLFFLVNLSHFCKTNGGLGLAPTLSTKTSKMLEKIKNNFLKRIRNPKEIEGFTWLRKKQGLWKLRLWLNSVRAFAGT